MDLQYIALQMFLHKGTTIEQAYQQAEHFLDYQVVYNAKKREVEAIRENMDETSKLTPERIEDIRNQLLRMY